MALSLLRTAESAAGDERGQDPGLAKQARERVAEVEARRQEEQAVAAAEKTLAGRPDDPSANLVRGKHLALTQGLWDQALPLLARGSDPDWRAAAEQDLVVPRDDRGKLTRGDAWWALGEKEQGLHRARLRWRACDWYEQAAPGSLPKAAEQRVLQARGAPSLPQAPNLIDPKADFLAKAPAANVRFDNGRLTLTGSERGYFSNSVETSAVHFACRVTGRSTGPASGGWGLAIRHESKQQSVRVRLHSNGVLFVNVGDERTRTDRRPLARVKHPRIHGHNETNELLVVVHGRTLEVYVNGVAMVDPIVLDYPVSPGTLRLYVQPAPDTPTTQAEFERLQVWPAENVQPLEVRAAK